MGEPSNTNNNIPHHVDDFYFSALSYGDRELADIFPVSDENYALELQLQEILYSSIIASSNSNSLSQAVPPPEEEDNARLITISKAQSSSLASASSSVIQETFCKICMEITPADEIFRRINGCSHAFCRACLGRYIGAKIGENMFIVKCPEENCKALLEPELCREFLPPPVVERWEAALCESMVLGARRFYCPFKDCSALMVDDGEEKVTQSECPSCKRLFCATCKVGWHSGLSCEEFGNLGEGERGREDLMMMEVAKDKKWRRCPNCRYFVEKTEGCLHITCRCGFEFCYGCGSTWSNAHASCNT